MADRSELRCFQLVGELLVDTYGTSPEGASLSYQAPKHVLEGLRWDPRAEVAHTQIDALNFSQRVERVISALSGHDFQELSPALIAEARLLAAPTFVQPLSQRLPALTSAWYEAEPQWLAEAASLLCWLDPGSVAAAQLLIELVQRTDVSAPRRASIAGALGDGIRPAVLAPGCGLLEAHVLESTVPGTWEPFGYCWARHLVRLTPRGSLDAFRYEMRTRGERERQLLANELAEVQGADVRGWLRDYLRHEPSVRVSLKLASILRESLSEARKVRLLGRALVNESPSVRMMAVRLMRIVRADNATTLLLLSLQAEPDASLRVLMTHALSAVVSTPGESSLK